MQKRVQSVERVAVGVGEYYTPPGELLELNIEIAKCDKSLSDPLLFAKDPARGKAVSKKRVDAIKKLETLEARWLKMQEEYELAMAEA